MIKLDLNKNFPYLVIIGLCIFLFFDKCSDDVKQGYDNLVKSDTIYITKAIPADTIRTVQKVFTPLYVSGNNSEILNKIAELEDRDDKIEFLLEKLQTRVYDSTYVYEKGKVRIKDSVQGSLLGREIDVIFNEVEFQEKVITNTLEKYPKFEIMAGLQTGATITPNNVVRSPFVGAYVGFKNQRGYELGASFNTQNQAQISLKKSIFTKYKKD